MNTTPSPSYPLILSYLSLRRIIGWIAVLLPLALVAARVFFHKQFNIPVKWPDSASGFYYTGMRDVFVGSLCALGVFLLAYRGYDWIDFSVTFVAGVCAIGVAVFPTKPTCPPRNSGCVTSNQDLVGNIHNGFAIALIILMGFMTLRFAKSAYQDSTGQTVKDRGLRGIGFANDWSAYGESTKDGKADQAQSALLKRHRNWFYRVSAAVTFICAGLFLLQAVTPWLEWFTHHIRVFLLGIETVAVLSFGAAWFVKGRALLLAAHRRQVLAKQALTHAPPEHRGAEPWEEVRKALAEGKSARKVAKEVGITRQRVTEIAAEIT